MHVANLVQLSIQEDLKDFLLYWLQETRLRSYLLRFVVLQLVHTCSLALASSKGESIVAFIGLLMYSICFQPIISVDIRLAKYANRYSILSFKN